MLSHGRHFERVPREFHENMLYRKKAANEPLASKQRMLKRMCAQDLLFYVNTFVWQFNPRCVGRLDDNPYSAWAGMPEITPFTTYPFQDKALTYGDPSRADFHGILWAIERQRDLVQEKSREMGVSWMNLIVIDWLWRFHGRKTLLVMSRDEDAVDKLDDPNSLFWKLDFIQDHLPIWLWPEGWDKRKHRKSMFIKNPETHSTITGEASTAKAFVGGRGTLAFIDEFSQIDKAREVLERTADVTGCRLFCGTHTGVDTAFYELCNDKTTAKLVLHWSEHPLKRRGLYEYARETNQIVVHDKAHDYPSDFQYVYEWKPNGGPFPGLRSPWYDEECIRRKRPSAIAMDLDINPKGATSQFFDPGIIHNLIRTYAIDPLWEGELNYDLETARPRELIRKDGGLVKMWVNPLGDGKMLAARFGGGCDISWGTGATPSCFSLINADTGEKVLEVKTPWMDPKDFAKLVVALCWFFKDKEGNPVRLAWEAEGPGVVFGDKVIELGYRAVYWRVDELAIGAKKSDRPGWAANPTNKRLLLSAYANALGSHQVVNRSRQALESCLDFRHVQNTVEHGRRKVKDDPSGAGENHGDMVIADALATKMVKEMGIAEKEPEKPEVKVMSLQWRRQQYEEQLRMQNEWS